MIFTQSSPINSCAKLYLDFTTRLDGALKKIVQTITQKNVRAPSNQLILMLQPKRPSPKPNPSSIKNDLLLNGTLH